jgi:monoterpene epsilon-lactone hydrolase
VCGRRSRGLGLRWFVKKRGYHQTLAAARKSARSMESLIPHPPRDVVTEALQIGRLRGYLVTTPASLRGRSILFLHGGGYRLYGASTYRHFTWRIAGAARARLLVIDYQLTPEHAFPAALEDALSGYDWLVTNGGAPHRTGIVGDSYGGGLALALLLKLRDDRKMLPASAALLSPWTRRQDFSLEQRVKIWDQSTALTRVGISI